MTPWTSLPTLKTKTVELELTWCCQGGQLLILQHHQVRSTLLRTLKSFADQLVGVFTTIFNIFLQPSAVPICLNYTTIVPRVRRSSVKCLTDSCPLALNPDVMKYFERLLMIKGIMPSHFDSHQFAFHANSSMDDAVSTALYTALTHMDSDVSILFIDFSSSLITLSPIKWYTISTTWFLAHYSVHGLYTFTLTGLEMSK